MKLVWTVAALIVCLYLGYAVGVLILAVTGTTRTTAHLQAVGGPCALIAGITGATAVYRWRRSKETA